AVAPGKRYITVPYVRPGGESLLQISGWPKVEKVLQAIDAIEALGIDPADANFNTCSGTVRSSGPDSPKIACRVVVSVIPLPGAPGHDPDHAESGDDDCFR